MNKLFVAGLVIMVVIFLLTSYGIVPHDWYGQIMGWVFG